ncbi:MAG: 4-hydroxy-tetrahydrodipicolinate reductase, partial [Burkholderiales bacterium]|nr:4-hydroxy-tetrahydrodipicolinate reductase [Burkholderiales bacterium]
MNIVIAGAGGRMGRALIEAVLKSEDLRLAGAFDLPGSPALGRDAGEGLGRTSGVRIVDDYEAAIAAADCMIDFTRPEGTMRHLEACVRLGKAAVIGTTGFS